MSRTRTRSRSYYNANYSHYKNDYTPVYNYGGEVGIHSWYEAITDETTPGFREHIGPLPSHDLSIYKAKGYPIRFNGTHTIPGFLHERWWYDDYAPQAALTDCKNSAIHIYNALPIWGSLETDALNKANPFANPSVDLAVDVLELRDFPSMLKHLGDIFGSFEKKQTRLMTQRLSELPINIEFGWAPLIRDFVRLYDYLRLVNDRLERINRLGYSFSSHGVRLRNQTWTETANYGQFGLNFTRRTISTAVSWAVYTARLNPGEGIGFQPPTWNDAFDAVYNTNVDYKALWQALPWSWFLDMWANVSDYLEANRHGTAIQVRDLNIMYNVKTTQEWTSTPPSGVSVKAGKFTAESKLRKYIPIPSPQLAFKNFMFSNDMESTLVNLTFPSLVGQLTGIATEIKSAR